MSSGTMDLNERRQADHQLRQIRDEARAEFVRQSEIVAIADAEYRRVKSMTYLECRDQAMPSNGAEIVANAAASEIRQKRDIAASLAKASLLKVSATDRDFVSIRDTHATSERIDGVAP